MQTLLAASFAKAFQRFEFRQLHNLSESNWTAIKSAYYRCITEVSGQQANESHETYGMKSQIAIRGTPCHSSPSLFLLTSVQDIESVLPRGDWKDKTGPVGRSQTRHHFLPRLDSQLRKIHRQRNDRRHQLADWLLAKQQSANGPTFCQSNLETFFWQWTCQTSWMTLETKANGQAIPELLDWLATEFQSDWDRKRLIRLIVTSNTYRQQADVLPELAKADPDNRLLAQQTARRLEAEIVRDNALAISGLLNTEWIGGESVFPFQPPGYYANLQFPNRRYPTQTNGLQYRRGLYMHWQRTFLHPMLTNFDAPSRDECAADRIESNSPQQALTLLNDPVFVEAARAFSIRLLKLDESSTEARIQLAFQIALSRKATIEELGLLQSLYQAQLEYFSANPNEAKSFCQVGGSATIKLDNQVEVAALAQVCRVILNLHEVITRY